MPGATPLPVPTDWVATVAPGAASVYVAAYSPLAVAPGQLALIGVNLVGFGVVAVLLLVLLMKRTV